MNKKIMSFVLAGVLLALSFTFATGNAAATNPAEMKSADNSIRLIVNEQTVSVAVFRKDGTATAYTAELRSDGVYKMTRIGGFRDAGADATLNANIDLKAKTATIGGVSRSLGAEDESGPCYTKSGTGVCNQVVDDASWWACFRCCLVQNCVPVIPPIIID